MFPSPLEVTGVSYFLAADIILAITTFPSPLEVTGVSY